MKIWQLNFEVDLYDNLVPVPKLSVEELQTFDGRSHLSHWSPLHLARMEPEKGLPLSDAPGFVFPVFSHRALDCLKPLIEPNIEILPLDFDGGNYFGINVTTVLDAVDYEKSIYKTFRDGKRIMSFKKYSFIPSVVDGVPIFKITDEKVRYAFVSDAFRDIVEKNKLTGFLFRQVWDRGRVD